MFWRCGLTAAQHSSQVLIFQGKSCSHFRSFTMQVWDRLSLQYAFRLAADGAIAPLPRPDGTSAVLHCRHHGDLSLRLAPYPFAQSPCSFPLQARLLPDRPYRNAEEFLAAMARAAVTMLECRASCDRDNGGAFASAVWLYGIGRAALKISHAAGAATGSRCTR